MLGTHDRFKPGDRVKLAVYFGNDRYGTVASEPYEDEARQFEMVRVRWDQTGATSPAATWKLDRTIVGKRNVKR